MRERKKRIEGKKVLFFGGGEKPGEKLFLGGGEEEVFSTDCTSFEMILYQPPRHDYFVHLVMLFAMLLYLSLV